MPKVLCEYKECLHNDWDDNCGCGECQNDEVYLSEDPAYYTGCANAEWKEEDD